jgi:hypothetical protein
LAKALATNSPRSTNTLPLANWKTVCHALPVARAIADWLVDHLEVLTLGGTDYRDNLTPQTQALQLKRGLDAKTAPHGILSPFFLDKASMHHCVLKATWSTFRVVILDKFLTGDNRGA